MPASRFLSLWLPVAIYMAAIFYFSSLSSLPGGVGGISDTVLHSVAYAGLALTTLRAVARGRWPGVTVAAVVVAWAVATAYGATDEWHQMYTPGRQAELRDLANDAMGAAAAVGLAGAWGTMRRSLRA